jgi:predicted ATPase
MPEQRSPNVIQVNLRLTKDLHKRLAATAKKAGRPLNSEMVYRLETTFRREKADEMLDRAQRLLDKARRISDDATRAVTEIERDWRAGLTVDEVFPRNRLLRRLKK